MKNNNLQTKLKKTVTALFLTVLLVWVFFFLYTSRSLRNDAEKNAEQAAGQIIDVLQEQFLMLERVSFTLSQSELVGGFAIEQELLSYHEKAQDVTKLLDGMMNHSGFVEHLIIFSDSKNYYRFLGNMGNTSATKVYWSAQPTEQPHHLIIMLDGAPYIGYASSVYSSNKSAGDIILLIEENKLLALFDKYRDYDALQISLVADEKVITSNDSSLKGLIVDEVRFGAYSAVSRKVGFTPFEILVTTKKHFSLQSNGIFALTAAVTIAIFAVLIAMFTSFLKRNFIAPMLEIMHGVETLGTGSTDLLPIYNEENFDRLAERINDMLKRLDERNKTIFETNFKLQNAEIQKQKAVIISLKKQISAHFTVNVLNVIKRLSEKGEQEKTSEMCDGLSYMIRYANAGDEFINGLEEFFVLQKYVAIMQIRYHGRFDVEFDPDERLGDVSIPRMLIQPLVENAILHGLQKEKKGGRLLVCAKMDHTRLKIVVEDNGLGMNATFLKELCCRIADTEEEPFPTGLEHIALLNIERRAKSYYGGESGLRITSKQGEWTKVTLVLDGVC